ncbi:hypothetical protein GR925_25830 [Streptomyces sp. HUCO-GS316]|uniref:hypothetical protein n=1 Tax=Streptomyces sp. HUCO-GS316 TaxID=2692198 RepID=UPI00136E1FD0|nr:hypothetical protein [Streptomyces sp. HUCO-GS316]MXM66757.1 hypothetical protein [Streptomyces sp. HUCO-GS316]
MNFRTASPDELRAFLRLCLNPRPGQTRTTEALAGVLPGPLLQNLHGHVPALGKLHAEVQRTEEAAAAATTAYAKALTAWLEKEDAGPALCTQNGRGDKATPRPHDFPDDRNGPPHCLWCGVPAQGSVPGYRTPDGREWTLAGECTEGGLPLYEAPFVGTRYTADALTALHGTAEPLSAVQPPLYVFNARSVNRRPGTAVKHIPTPDGTATICPRGYEATAPMPEEEAALLPLCGGCRDTTLAAAGLA